ncbi:MAG: response regulator transcription factor [Micrococcales bacterium]|nr:response regulator transcription factor [Micrococcales bacterium]MCL2667492.1 response regulator transcription factor [Micrococcales bacterium]
MNSPIRVILVDDQQLVRAGLSMVVNAQPDMRVVGEAGDGDAAVALVARTPADVVLMDVRMPRRDGIEATAAITADKAAPRIVMLTTYDLDEYLLAAIKAGASGFLLKDAPPDDLVGAIRAVHCGDAVIAPASTRRLIDHVAQLSGPDEDPERFVDLTDREREVLVLVARGLSNAEIAGTLYLAETTVKTHVGRILTKLGARDRVQAVVAAYEGGLVRPGAGPAGTGPD